MPARREKYPADWKAFSRSIRVERAGERCECTGECGLHRTTGGRRRCVERHMQPATWAKGKVVLTTAHLNRVPDGPCRCEPLCVIPEHVLAMCNRCHLRYDVVLHKTNALNRRRAGRAIGELPGLRP